MDLDNYLTTSYEVYKKRTENSFKMLDGISNHKNISEIYPHELFCNTIIKNRCLTHDDKNIYYEDDDHPSEYGSKLLNKLILNEIFKN